jgi:hypothetical protein
MTGGYCRHPEVANRLSEEGLALTCFTPMTGVALHRRWPRGQHRQFAALCQQQQEAESAAEGERTRPGGRLVVSALNGFGTLAGALAFAFLVPRHGLVTAAFLIPAASLQAGYMIGLTSREIVRQVLARLNITAPCF